MLTFDIHGAAVVDSEGLNVVVVITVLGTGGPISIKFDTRTQLGQHSPFFITCSAPGYNDHQIYLK